jgi:DNA-binding CsgD family transcriptional regulator/tetratricopeptide (TPR) repeat protein
MMGDVAVRTTAPLVGRDAELEELVSSLGGADAGGVVASGGATVLLSGDAGVGKTRLLAEVRDRLAADGWRVVAGHCLDLGDSALPYLPFSEILGRLAAELPDVVATVAGHHPTLARLQPGRRTLAGETAEGGAVERSALFEAVRALLEEVARDRPLLVVVEDTHWADQSTRDLLTFLFAREAAAPVSLVVSYRADDLHRRHPLRRHLAEWSRVGGVRRLALAPLGDEAVARLIGELVPGGLSAEETLDIVDRAEGNAFFVEELTSAASGPGRWVPAELADVLLVRLDRLDDRARQVVRAASVAGRKVAHDLLAAASGLDPAALDEGLRQAVEMNVLVPDGDRYAFRHALLGEAVYDDLLPGERVRLHDAFATALREGVAAGTAAELARHSRLAHDLETALHASIRAGHDALGVGGPDEAVHHYEQALELLSDPRREAGVTDVDRSALVVHLADALTASGRPHRAATLLGEELAGLPADAPAAWRARILAAQSYLLLITETEEDPAAVSAEAYRLVPEGDTAVRARVLATHARVLTAFRRFEEAQPVALEGLALAERLNLTDTVSDLVVTLSQARHSGPQAGLREALEEAVSTARGAGAVQAELRAHFLLGRSFEDVADWEGADAAFRRGMQRGEETGLPFAPYAFESRWHLLFEYVVRGRWDAALDLVAAAGSPPQVQQALLDLFRLEIEQARGGDVGDRLPALRRLWATEGLIAVHSGPMEMVDAARRGDPAGVLAAYDAAVGVLARLWQPWFPARVRLAATTLGALADVAPSLPAADRDDLLRRATDVHADGLEVVARVQERGGTWGPEGRAWSARLDAELLRLRWLVGDPPAHDALVGAWREVEARFAEFGEVHQVATVRVVLAGVLRAGGDVAAAREVADLARATARELGARPLLDALTGLGSRAVRHSAGSDTLTARETEILALVAQGRSNGEIGKQLFIATKTVSVHVSNILGKLGAASRTEAAALARRRGLLD